MIKIGSRVKFLHSTGAGIVRSIDGDLAMVEVDGFEIPALVSDIIAVSKEEENKAIIQIGPDNSEVKKKKAQQKTTIEKGQRYGRISLIDEYEDEEPINIVRIKKDYRDSVTKNVQQTIVVEAEKPAPLAPYKDLNHDVRLAFVVQPNTAPESSDLDMYIINDGSYHINYCIGLWKGDGHVETLKVDRIEPGTKEFIKKMPRSSFAQIQTLYVSIQPYKSISFTPQAVEDFDLELHPLKFVRPGNYVKNPFFHEPAFLFTLNSVKEQPNEEKNDISDLTQKFNVSQTKYKDAKPNATKKHKDSAVQVEDLHIENLLETWNELPAGEVLDVQVSRFKIVLDTAIKAKQRGKIVFIHGVGKGKLKYELKRTLDSEYPKLRYQDASFQEYGYGAIMVFL